MSEQEIENWNRIFKETVYLGKNWRANLLFNMNLQDLTDELKKMKASGTVKPEMLRAMVRDLRGLVDTQSLWLWKEWRELEASIN